MICIKKSGGAIIIKKIKNILYKYFFKYECRYILFFAKIKNIIKIIGIQIIIIYINIILKKNKKY
jgi:hypothetical protein